MRGPLPTFNDAWDQRETPQTRGCRIATLCRAHTFQHACVHAAMDRWNSLRHMIVTERLASQLPGASLAALSRHSVVRRSCAVTFDLTGSETLLSVAQGPAARISQRTRTTVRQAWLSQALPTSREASAWTLKERLDDVWRLATPSPDFRDWLRVVSFSVLWP